MFKNLGTHLKAHKISSINYKKKYGEISYKNEIINKMKDLFIIKRSKWLMGYRFFNENNEFEGRYRTNDSTKSILNKTKFLDRPLTDKDISKHLELKHIIGTYFPKGFTRIFCFDVDGKGTSEPYKLAQPIVLDIIGELKKYIAEDNIHVVFSGNKGYHIWLFFDELVKISEILNFAQEITKWNVGNVEVGIDLRPESNDGKAVKLPLGKHINTGEFCPFVDKNTFQPVEDSYEYLLKITKIKPIDFKPFARKEKIAIEKSKNNKNSLGKSSNLYESYELEASFVDSIYKNGLPGFGHRHHYTFLLAMHLKDAYIMDKDSVINVLMEWTENEFKAGRTQDNAQKSSADIISTVENVFTKNLSLHSSRELNEFEKSIISIATSHLPKNTIRQKLYAEKLQRCFEVILRIAKSGNINGFFFLSKPLLAKEIGCDKRTITRYLDKLLKSLLFFCAVKGASYEDFYDEMVEAAALYSENKNFFEWFQGLKPPTKGYSSLYYCPVIIGEQFEGYDEIIWNEAGVKLIKEYSVISWYLAYMNSEEILFKHEILLENKRKIDPAILEQHNKRAMSMKENLCEDDKELENNLSKIKKSLERAFDVWKYGDEKLNESLKNVIERGII